jgi:hypothetical protein
MIGHVLYQAQWSFLQDCGLVEVLAAKVAHGVGPGVGPDAEGQAERLTAICLSGGRGSEFPRVDLAVNAGVAALAAAEAVERAGFWAHPETP